MMAKIKRMDFGSFGIKYLYFCPACMQDHCFSLKNHQFNGDLERPTVSPSLLTIQGKRCHSFIRDGKIEFLSDCDHSLSGRILDLPEYHE